MDPDASVHVVIGGVTNPNMDDSFIGDNNGIMYSDMSPLHRSSSEKRSKVSLISQTDSPSSHDVHKVRILKKNTFFPISLLTLSCFCYLFKKLFNETNKNYPFMRLVALPFTLMFQLNHPKK